MKKQGKVSIRKTEIKRRQVDEMMAENKAQKVYLRLFKRVKRYPSEPVMLKHIALIHAEEETKKKIAGLVLLDAQEAERKPQIIELMGVIAKIKQLIPDAEIEYIGEPQTVVEFSRPRTKKSFLYIAVIWLLLFTGSGLAIMNFHADVSMMAVHQKLYTIITGQEKTHPLWLQIPYSLGIGSGMILFFNRFFKRRLNDEPDPLELEIFQYDDHIQTYRIAQKMKAEAGQDAADGRRD
jgi:stage V sporulation protein AA